MDGTNTRRVLCYKCNEYTKTNPPIVFVRPGRQNFKISGLCDICQLAKTKFIQSGIKKILPRDIVFRTRPNRTSINFVETDDGRRIDLFKIFDPIINPRINPENEQVHNPQSVKC